MRSVSLADVVARAWRDAHPSNRDALLCVRCRRRLDRSEFRETPNHGRGPECRRCDGMDWEDCVHARTAWLLEQEREKVRGLRLGLARIRDRHARDMVAARLAVISLKTEIRKEVFG